MSSTTRRESREWIVQILFQLDLNRCDDLDQCFDRFWADKDPDAKAREFVEEIVNGVLGNIDKIDSLISEYAENWTIGRMGVLDRNVLRMAVYEMLHRDDIPPVVSINEAVDVAKYFSSSESGRFVNGILDRVRKEIDGGQGIQQ